MSAPAMTASRSGARRLGAGIVAALLALIAAQASAAEAERNVLVLYSYSRLLPANLEFDQGLQAAIARSSGRPVGVFNEFLDFPRFVGDPYGDTVATYLREKYATRTPAVIVAVSSEALRFLLDHREAVFPSAAIVHALVETSFLRSNPPLPADAIGVPIEYDFSSTIDQALRWHPVARRVVIVTGAAARDREWELRLREEVGAFGARAAVEFLTGLPTPDLLRRLGELGSDAVVFTPGYFQDGDGRDFTPKDSAAGIAAASTAPVYGPFSTFLGTGVVGGRMHDFGARGEEAGREANELLSGVTPSAVHLPPPPPSIVNVDWRQAQRWGIDDDEIPADAVVLFRTPGFLELYRTEALVAAAAFTVLLTLVVLLAGEHRRRTRAEQNDQNLRVQVAHAARLAVAGELMASIAHEINQPLGAILSNADAGDLLLDSGTDQRAELRAILADIRRDDLRASEVIARLRALITRQEVERRPYDAGGALNEVASFLRAEAGRRRVTLDFRLGGGPAAVVGDRVQLQQVVINLVLNAMDAVADLPEARRTVAVSVDRVTGGIEISVRDRGQGIAPEHLPKLFDSFFTTKRQGMGLGLSIARTLVEAQGGRIWAEGGKVDGAVFHVELPAARTVSAPVGSTEAKSLTEWA